MGVFQYAVATMISNILIKSWEARQIGKLFMQIDTNKDGVITLEEFQKSDITQHALNFAGDASIEELFNNIDVDQSGTIEYSEFITATMDKNL